MVEFLPSKQAVAGSNPVSRSTHSSASQSSRGTSQDRRLVDLTDELVERIFSVNLEGIAIRGGALLHGHGAVRHPAPPVNRRSGVPERRLRAVARRPGRRRLRFDASDHVVKKEVEVVIGVQMVQMPVQVCRERP